MSVVIGRPLAYASLVSAPPPRGATGGSCDARVGEESDDHPHLSSVCVQRGRRSFAPPPHRRARERGGAAAVGAPPQRGDRAELTVAELRFTEEYLLDDPFVVVVVADYHG